MLQKKAIFLGLFTEKTYFCTIIEENYNKKVEGFAYHHNI